MVMDMKLVTLIVGEDRPYFFLHQYLFLEVHGFCLMNILGIPICGYFLELE